MRFRIFLLCFLVATVAHHLDAQDLTGSTNLDIDPTTNIVTATCETDIDDGDYEADVYCSVVDGAGNVMAHEGDIDHGGQGYAQVVLTFQGQPGTNYIATASHIAIYNIVDLPEEPSQPTYYEDPYNFEYFEEEGIQTYPDSYIWVGPGPQVQTRKPNVRTGNTEKANAIPPPTISLNFTENASKNPSDNLSFLNGTDCSETLGPRDCTIKAQWWLYNLEGTVAVNDDASKWTLSQTKNSIVYSGNTKDGNGILHPFSNTIPFTNAPDGPNADFLQQVSGSKTIFWIDAPGRINLGDDGNPIDSLNWFQSYSVNVCSTIVPTVCATQSWHVKLIVKPGSQLSYTESVAALGGS